LHETLGQHSTGFLTSLSCAGQTGRDARPTTVTDHPIADLGLRHAYKISRTITEAFDDKATLAWLFGTNVDLDDKAPITILREADDPNEFAAVLAAARSLVSFGG
jgi:hypothetical protein